MFAEWSAACGTDDPVLVVPWSDAASSAAFIDLRENPYDLDQVAEAEQHPPLMQALRSLNAGRSAVYTAKCDAWPMGIEEREALAAELDEPEPALAGFASYIDLIFRERSLFASSHQQEQLLDRLTRRAAAIDRPGTALECVLRPALVDLTTAQEGFAITLYVKALGPDTETAWQLWSAALEQIVTLLRSRELLPS